MTRDDLTDALQCTVRQLARTVFDRNRAGESYALIAADLGTSRGVVAGLVRDWRYKYRAQDARTDAPRTGLGDRPLSHGMDLPSSDDPMLPPPKASGELHFGEGDGSAWAWSRSRRIATLDDLLAACHVDLALWEVERHVINKWEVGSTIDDEIVVEPLVQVKAWLRPRTTAPVEQVLEALVADLREIAPVPLPRPKFRARTGEYLLVPNLYDAHVNKRSFDGAYTIDRAASDFKAVVDAVVARVQSLALPVERVMFPAGNDALHADSLAGTTTQGTWVELAADQRDAVDALIDAYRHAITRLSEIAPVDVVTVESNHDRFSSYWLGKVLEALFSQHDDVTVDAARNPRKYYVYGATLLGLEHGDKVRPRDLAALMATEVPCEWAAARYREWLRGHIHHSAGMYYPITGDGGVTVRVIPALCPPDEYHVLRGFVGGQRAAEVMYYHRDCGPAGVFPVFVDEVVTHSEHQEKRIA